MDLLDYPAEQIKTELNRLIARYGPTKVMHQWKRIVEDLRETVRTYDSIPQIEQTLDAQPELVYQRKETKKPRKTRQKKTANVSETSQ